MSTRDYRVHSNSIASDLDAQFDQDPDAIDVLLFKARHDLKETVTETPDIVGALEASERAIQYDDPIPTKAIIVPFDFRFMALDDGRTAGQSNEGNQPIILLIKEDNVPKQSVVQWDEYVSDTEVERRTYYVLLSEAYGQAPVITMAHYCIPFADDDGTFEGYAYFGGDADDEIPLVFGAGDADPDDDIPEPDVIDGGDVL